MKQKIVIKVCMKSHKSRSKALGIVAGLKGLESVGLGGEDREKIEILGDGVDVAELTTMLRKKVGYAEIVSVTNVVEGIKKEEKKETVELQKLIPVDWLNGGALLPQWHPIYERRCADQYQYDDPYACSIM